MSIRSITATCVVLSFVLLLGVGNILAGQATSLWGVQEAVDVLEGDQPYAEKGENYGRHFMSEYWYIAHTGTPVRLTPEFWGGTEPLRSFAWDYESDGIIDYISKVMVAPEYTFKSAGEYTATLYAIDIVGGVSTGRMHFKVEPGYGEMVATDPPMFDLTGKVKGSAGSATDSVTYAWILSGREGYQYYRGLSLYRGLQRNYQFPDSAILFQSCWYPEGPHGCESLLVDIKWSFSDEDYCSPEEATDSAVSWLYEHLGPDDRLLIFSIEHGWGQPDSDVVVLGKWHTSLAAPFWPAQWGVQGPDDADQRYLESEAPRTYNFAYGEFARTVGMNEWYANILVDRYRREILVATYDSLDFIEFDTLMSDSDIWLETIRQYPKADTNHNFTIESYEEGLLDFDDDGNPPVDTNALGEFVWDEDDWGDLSLYKDQNQTYFDSGFDGIADFTLVAGDSAPTIFGSDYDNDGIIVGYDCNLDGDVLDSVGADANGTSIPDDDYLAAILDSLEYRSAHIVMGNCYSGGFINDVSRENVSIITYAPDGATNCGGVGDFVVPMLDSTLSADVNADSLISFVEAFNASLDLLVDPIREYGCWYDDNGDGEPTIGEVGPSSLDGDLGDDEFWGTYHNWYLPSSVHPEVVSPDNGDSVTTEYYPILHWSIDTALYDYIRITMKQTSSNGSIVFTDSVVGADSVVYTGAPLLSPSPYWWSVQAFFCDTMSHIDTAIFEYYYKDPCCINRTGNVNGDSLDVCDISDLTYLVNYVNAVYDTLPCMPEGNVNGFGLVDISDVSRLAAYLFNEGPAPEFCP